MSDTEDKMRARVAEFLPDAMTKALESYNKFLTKENETTSKTFKEQHDACKTAIAHIELLLKLAEKMGVFDPDSESDAQEAFSEMMRRAQEEVNDAPEE